MNDPAPLRSFTLQNDDGEVLAVLPSPGMLAALINEQVERDVAALRGEVHAKHDVFPALRYIRQADELLAEYVRTLRGVQTKFQLLIEEVAADGVGADDDGKPLASLTVPDIDGDIRITRKGKNTHRISTEAVLPAFASMFADQHVDAVINAYRDGDGEHACCASAPKDPAEHRAAVGVTIAEAISDALNNVGELGKFEPQVSKVRAYADALSRAGYDGAASVVAGSISTTKEYGGITVERKEAK